MIQTVNPPKGNAYVSVASTPATLQSLLGDGSAYPNNGGFQIGSLGGNTASLFWGLSNDITISSKSAEIPAGAAQLVTPAQAADTAHIWLIAASAQIACISFPGG